VEAENSQRLELLEVLKLWSRMGAADEGRRPSLDNASKKYPSPTSDLRRATLVLDRLVKREKKGKSTAFKTEPARKGGEGTA